MAAKPARGEPRHRPGLFCSPICAHPPSRALALASRLCKQAEHCEILIDACTVELTALAGLVERPPVQVKGHSEAVPIRALPE